MHAATFNGEFAGYIASDQLTLDTFGDSQPDAPQHRLFGPLGQLLGAFASLHDAQAALEATLETKLDNVTQLRPRSRRKPRHRRSAVAAAV